VVSRALILLSIVLASCVQSYQCNCPEQIASLTLHVVDATTNAVIASPTFSENGAPLAATCVDTACTAWWLELVGDHSVTIAASGYTAQTIDVSLVQPPGCCSKGTQLDQTVMLSR
jgi:hypothetical protein